MADFIHFTLIINKKGKDIRYNDISGVNIERTGNNIFVKYDQGKNIFTILLDRNDTIKIDYETFK